MDNQGTIKKDVAVEGVGLHTGNKVKVTFKPADANSGIRFVRVDLPNRPEIRADFSHVLVGEKGIPRCTSIGCGEASIHTVEHVMSVLCGLKIDNLIVEINGNEVPGLDGSGLDFLKVIKSTGIAEQDEDRKYFEIKAPFWVEHNGSCIYMSPASDFHISYTLDYRHPFLHSQFFSAEVTPETFEKDIAPCRTFCLEAEAEELKRRGLGRGANLKNTLVVGEKGVKENTLRFENEFARHKVLDFIGDLYLLGVPVKGHVVAVKSGHTLNLQLLKKISAEKNKIVPQNNPAVCAFDESKGIDIEGIMKVLPHRFPFLLVDRVLELEKGKRAVGLKNVTINDNFFQGHFPSRPVMPGVLMIEAMAQLAGLTVLTAEQTQGKLAFFLSADNVKFRKVVSPGDQLMLEVEVLKSKPKVAQIRAVAKVDGQIVSEADLVFSFVDEDYLI